MGSIILYKSTAMQEEVQYNRLAFCTDEPKDTLKALCRKYIIWDYLGCKNFLSTAENEVRVTNNHGLIIRPNIKGPLGTTVTESILSPSFDHSELERAIRALSPDTTLKKERTDDDLKYAMALHMLSEYSNPYNKHNPNENYMVSFDNTELRERKKRSQFYPEKDKQVLVLLEAAEAMLGIKTREELRSIFKAHHLASKFILPED